jgi:hypothetical protein
MPNCDFYALALDSAAVLEFVFSNRGWQLTEAYSAPDQDICTFTSLEAVTSAFDLTRRAVHLMLHAPEMRERNDGPQLIQRTLRTWPLGTGPLLRECRRDWSGTSAAWVPPRLAVAPSCQQLSKPNKRAPSSCGRDRRWDE